MSIFTHKLASLVLLTLVTTLSWNAPWAATPWEEEGEDFSDIAPPTKQLDETPLTPASNAFKQEMQTATHHPAMMEETPAQPEKQPVAQTQTVTQTQKTGDHLNMQMQTADPIAVRIVDFPRRGMSTDKVQNELGRPSEIIPAIGAPPISRWVYDDRIVYFEHSSVIHVVAK